MLLASVNNTEEITKIGRGRNRLSQLYCGDEERKERRRRRGEEGGKRKKRRGRRGEEGGEGRGKRERDQSLQEKNGKKYGKLDNIG